MKRKFADKNIICFLCSKKFQATEKENGRAVKILSTPCNHLFHRVCLRTWFPIKSNGNFCPQCKHSMDWRDATPVGKETKTSHNSPRTNSQSETEVTVLSLDAEIRQRKAQELLQQKQEAERAKFKLSGKQRGEAQKKRRQRREDRKALINSEEQGNIKEFLVTLIILILSSAFSAYTFRPAKTVDPPDEIVLNAAAAMRLRFEQVKEMWQQKLEKINRHLKHLGPSFADFESKQKRNELEENQDIANQMVEWLNDAELTEEKVEIFHDDMEELADLAEEAVYSQEGLQKFRKRCMELLGLGLRKPAGF